MVYLHLSHCFSDDLVPRGGIHRAIGLHDARGCTRGGAENTELERFYDAKSRVLVLFLE